MYDEQLVKLFRIYLSHGVAFMRYGDNELYQVIITHGIDNKRPMTRDYLYAEETNSKGFNEHLLQFDENIKSTT